MTDPLDRLLRPPQVEPLAPPVGHFAEITRRARGRRQRRAAGVGLLSAGVVAGAIGGSVLLTGPATRHADVQTPSSASSAGPASPSPSAARVLPSPAPTAGGAPIVGPTGQPPVGRSNAPVPARFTPQSVTYVSARTGYLLGDAPCPRPVCTSLVTTTDGGVTWHGLPAPVAPLASPSGGDPQRHHVRDVRFANSRDGWVFGGALYATHDGGARWAEISLPAGLVADLATDGHTAYALVASCASGGSCLGYRLYQTPVNADDWQPVPGVDAPTATGGRLAVSGSHAVVALDTHPGSAVWVRRAGNWSLAAGVPCVGGLPVAGLAASAAGARLVAMCGEGAAGSLYLTPWVSDDSGASWQKAADGSARAVTGVPRIAAATDRLILVASGAPGLGGTVLRSTDGGRTFADAALPTKADGWSYVGARSATSLVALPGTPDGSIWTSGDGGVTWRPYRFR